MAANAPSRGRTITIWILRIFLAIVFLAVGTTKLTGTGNTIEYFAAIGWGQWFRYVTGVVDVIGAALTLVPRWSSFGATMVACSVGLGTLISVTVLRSNPAWGTPEMVALPLVLTLLAFGLAWITRKPPNTIS